MLVALRRDSGILSLIIMGTSAVSRNIETLMSDLGYHVCSHHGIPAHTQLGNV